MEKRIFLAIVISLAVLLSWAAIAPRLFPELARKPEAPRTAATQTSDTATTSVAPPTATTSTTTATETASQPSTVAAAPSAVPVKADRAQTTVVETPDYRAVFSNRGAQLTSFELKRYPKDDGTGTVDLVRARDAQRTDYPFTLKTADARLTTLLNSALYAVTDSSEGGTRTIEYRYSDGRTTATKTFRFRPQPYLFDFSVSVQPPVAYRVAIGPGIRTPGADQEDTQVISTGHGVVQAQGDFEIIGREKGDPLEVFETIDYVGIEDNYFLAVLRPGDADTAVFERTAFTEPATKKRRIDLYAAVNAERDGSVSGDAFFGPKETKLLDAYGLSEALQFGWFDVIARFLLKALVWINEYTKNYGFAIIVLTIIIKIVLYPLQHKSIVSMKKMQRVQPKVEAIRARYKKAKSDAEQRQKMNVEMMQLYQKEGINPMAGCLPIVLQLPILWGFYNLLSRAIELRGAPWILWIKDLSDKDPTYILPILMTATMFIQTYITPSTGDPAQRRIFLIMPLVFGFLFKDFPSGLVLYWLVQNVLTIAQQMIMNKWWKDHPEDNGGDK